MIDRDKAYGVYIGAAIGDAMGGPVECQHAARIKRIYGKISGLLPYRKPPGMIEIQSGYALQPDPGSITDDTFIRAQVTRYILEDAHPRSAEKLAHWLFNNADFEQWPFSAVKSLIRVVRGDVSAEEAGATAKQGGYVGWWTPIGIIHAGDPEWAAEEARTLCSIFKAPLEKDLLSAVQAGIAAGFREGAGWDDVLNVILDSCGPLARKVLERAAELGRTATDHDDLVGKLYDNCLYDEFPIERDARLPESLDPLPDSDELYTSVLLAEQLSLAIGAFVFSKGDPVASVPNCVMLGRDCDSSSTAIGSWVGALHGESAFPREWVETVYAANMGFVDIHGLATQLIDVADAERRTQ